MATQNLELGKSYRLYIGSTATPANDTNYTQITNENSVTVSYAADNEEVDTKEAGKITLPGAESYEISFDFNHAFTDAGFTLLEGAKNTAWAYQIRKEGTPDTVWLEGTFLLTEMEYTMETVGVRSGSCTLKNTNAVTINGTPRALVTS